MNEDIKRFLKTNYGIDAETAELVDKAESEITDVFRRYDETAEYNQYKVLKAFHGNYISDTHFA